MVSIKTDTRDVPSVETSCINFFKRMNLLSCGHEGVLCVAFPFVIKSTSTFTQKRRDRQTRPPVSLLQPTPLGCTLNDQRQVMGCSSWEGQSIAVLKVNLGLAGTSSTAHQRCLSLSVDCLGETVPIRPRKNDCESFPWACLWVTLGTHYSQPFWFCLLGCTGRGLGAAARPDMGTRQGTSPVPGSVLHGSRW